jgi:hypothetical protein
MKINKNNENINMTVNMYMNINMYSIVSLSVS